MGRVESLHRKVEQKECEHPPYGVFLDEADLAELIIASNGNNPDNWQPGKPIQIPSIKVRYHYFSAYSELLRSGRYSAEVQGGNTLLKLTGEIDERIKKIVELVGLKGLMPLISLVTKPDVWRLIHSVTIFPNTSLGKDLPYPGVPRKKINGVIVQLREKPREEQTQQLLELLSWPFCRILALCELKGITVDDFVEHFGDGNELKPEGPKFTDFYFDDEKGNVYVLMAGGGRKDLPPDIFRGPDWKVAQNFRDIESSSINQLNEFVRQLTTRIGRGVDFQLHIACPYVSYYPNERQLVSGGATGLMLFNSGPNTNLILSNVDTGVLPIGNSGTLSTIINWNGPSSEQSFIPISNFGLPGFT